MSTAPQGVGGITSLGVQAGRRCRVEVVQSNIPNDPVIRNISGMSPAYVEADSGGTRQKLVINEADTPTGLRVKFEFSWQATQWAYNIGYIEIYGLNEEHRNFVTKNKGNPSIIYAGYVGTQLVRIGTLNGHQVTPTAPSMSEPTWVMKIEGGDGGSNSRTKVNATYAAGTPIADVIKMLGQGMGRSIAPGSQATLSAAAAARKFDSGYCYYGKPQREFKALLEDIGCQYTIQNEEIVIAQRNGTGTQQVFVLSPSSGMIGSFTRMAPVPGFSQIKGTVLLNGSIRPWSRVLLQDCPLAGDYVAYACKHAGDSYGTGERDWSTELTLRGKQVP